jgi:hypothetical protein
MSLFQTFPEAELLKGVEVAVFDFVKVKPLPITIRLIEETNGRRRVELSALYVPTGYNTYEQIFGRVGEIVADPHNVKPQRPVGHVFSEHTQPTARWTDDALKAELESYQELDESEWTLALEDGGSWYYMLNLVAKPSTPTIIRQIAKSSLRTLIGKVEKVTLPVEWGQHDVNIGFDLLKRVVVVEGNEGRSPVGSTNYDLFGLHL